MEGFVQGVGKGIIGVAAQPVSGVLDLLSKTTEGANAVRMKITSAITSGEQLLRKRLPRVIGGQNLIKPFDEYGATGQVLNNKYSIFFSALDNCINNISLLGKLVIRECIFLFIYFELYM